MDFAPLLFIGMPALLIGAIFYLVYSLQSRSRRRKANMTQLAAYVEAPTWMRAWEVGAVLVALFIGVAIPYLIYLWFQPAVFEIEALQWLYIASVVGIGLSSQRIAALLVGRRVARKGRAFWLAVNPGTLPSEPETVLSVVADWSTGGIEHTVACMADGTVSVYTNRGFSFVTHLPTQDDAAMEVMRCAQRLLRLSTPLPSTTALPFPSPELVRVHVRTPSHLRVIEGGLHEMTHGEIEISELFNAARRLFFRLLEAARGGRALES